MFSIIKKIFNKPDFKTDTPQPNNVLLVETNGCHGEVIAAYIQYFQRLNKNVYCLVNKRVARENPFCRLSNIKQIYSVIEIIVKNIICIIHTNTMIKLLE